MSNKSIPSEVVQGVVDLAKDTAMAALEAGSGGAVKKQSITNPQQTASDDHVKKQIEELQKQDKNLIDTEMPSLKRILEQQEEERQILVEEKEEKNQEELREMQELHEKKMEEQISSADALAATGSKAAQNNPFVSISKEKAKNVVQ